MLIFLPQEIAMTYKQLTIEERYQIKAYLKIGMTQKQIAEYLNLYPATISREIKRNLGKRGYRPKQAGEMARKRRLKAPKAIRMTPDITIMIERLIRQELRPEQVCDYLASQGMIKLHHVTIYTLVERKTLFTVIVKLNGKNAKDFADKAISALDRYKHKIHTMTYDNGLEFAEHEVMAEKLQADIYFAHPYSSWERGINENTNGLIRQYFPKGTDFNQVTEQEIEFVMNRLNSRPRKTREGIQPIELFLGKAVNLLTA
jgi:IS30 family transposase